MSIESKARKIKVLVLDVDGVFTDGGLYYGPDNMIMKRFNVQDGLGIKVGQRIGLQFAVITGLDHEVVERRVRELGITEYYAGHLDKRDSLESIRRNLGVEYEEMAYLGDDWVDIMPIRIVGLALAVANAQPEVLALADHVTTARGGDGAIREVIRFLLESQGRLSEALEQWCEEGGCPRGGDGAQ